MFWLHLLMSITFGCGALVLIGTFLTVTDFFQDHHAPLWAGILLRVPFALFWLGGTLLGFILPWLMIH